MENADVSLACNILWLEGHEHFALGHVSERLAGDGYVIKASGLGLGETRPEDMVAVDLEGRSGQLERLHAEAPIHTEIYRSRPDVQAVVHTHHPAVAALSASDAALQMVSQDSVYFWNRHSVFDSAAMIVDRASGEALARALGGGRAVVLRNHGLVTVGASLTEAVILAVSLARSAATQLNAAALGSVTPMPQRDLEALSRSFEATYEKRLTSVWSYLERMLRSNPGAQT